MLTIIRLCCPRRAVLPGFIIVAVLLATHQEVASDIGHDGVTAHVRAVEDGIAPAGHRDRAAAVEGSFRPGSTVTLLMALRRIHIGKDADTVAAGAATDADPHARYAVLCPAFHFYQSC